MKNLINICIWGMILTPLICFISSCSEEEDCSLSARPLLYCNLFTIDEITELPKKDTLEWLTITATGTDSIILNKQENVFNLMLPLNYNADSTELIFHYQSDKKLTDTLIIYHTNTPYFLSMDCGYQMKQSVTKIAASRHKLDSIHISNPEAGIYGTENIQIFY